MSRKAISLIRGTEIYITNVAIVISSTFNPFSLQTTHRLRFLPFWRECWGLGAGSIEETLFFLDVVGILRCREMRFSIDPWGQLPPYTCCTSAPFQVILPQSYPPFQLFFSLHDMLLIGEIKLDNSITALLSIHLTQLTSSAL